jgi:hypothetical protein
MHILNLPRPFISFEKIELLQESLRRLNLPKILGMSSEPAKKTLSEEFAEAELQGKKDAIWELRVKNREEKTQTARDDRANDSSEEDCECDLSDEEEKDWTYIDPNFCSIQ